MKHIIIILALALAPLAGAGQIPSRQAPSTENAVEDFEAYRNGFNAGWDAGWKKVKGQFSIPAIPPIPRIPAPGRMNYEAGFVDGVLAGMRRANQ